MALRLVDAAVGEADDRDEDLPRLAEELAEEHGAVDGWAESGSGDRGRVLLLVDADRVEGLMEELESRFGDREGFRIMLLPVEAAIPRPEEPEDDGHEAEEDDGDSGPTRGRVSREELHARLSDSAETDGVYLILTALSALVCGFGLLTDEVAVVIGAMVIAPLLGPVIALGLATTLADLTLGRRAVLTSAAGLAAALLVSVAMGALVHVDPTLPGIAARTEVGLADLGLAVAAGAAGTLAFTAGTAEAVIGVMVAVALVPPLVTGGLLLGAGRPDLATGGLVLTTTNLVGLNLSSVATFLLHGLRPTRWWEAQRARQATRLALAAWTLLSLVLAALIWFEF
jgi:uncharacterized hydrophobic protein (TIGR00341 family)